MIQRGTSFNCLIDFIFSLYHVSQSSFSLNLITKRSVKRDTDCFILLK